VKCATLTRHVSCRMTPRPANVSPQSDVYVRPLHVHHAPHELFEGAVTNRERGESYKVRRLDASTLPAIVSS